MRSRAILAAASFAALIAITGAAAAQNLAPGFAALPQGAKVAIMPTDVELFSISAGGVAEPKADWTEAAARHFRAALVEKQKKALKLDVVELAEKDADELDEINALHGAIARAISVHHLGPSNFRLPTKEGQLDWSIGESARLIRKMTGADYALFSWVRDSYTSDERKAAMVAMAILSLGRVIPTAGGLQIGYASLVDLNTGRVRLAFEGLRDGAGRAVPLVGDRREAETAAETVDALLSEFPITK